MTPSEIQQIVDAIKPKEKSDNTKMSEMFFKFIGTASFALVAFLFNNSNQMQKDMIEIKSNQLHIVSKVNKMEAFTDKPRYTKENAVQDLEPLKAELTFLKNEFRSLDVWREKRENIEAKLNLEMHMLKSKN